MKKSKKLVYSDLFLVLAIVFVTCLLLSNILAVKLLKVWKYSIPASVLVFPISYIINDIFSEIYGFEKTKRVIVLGFIMNFFMALIFSLAIILPAPAWFQNSEAFATILGTTPRICVASLIAYLLGSLVNAKVLVVLKERQNNSFGVRAVVSTIFGEFVDSVLFVTISFIGSVPIDQLLVMIFIQVILKTMYEMVCLPITKMVIKGVKKYEGIK